MEADEIKKTIESALKKELSERSADLVGVKLPDEWFDVQWITTLGDRSIDDIVRPDSGPYIKISASDKITSDALVYDVIEQEILEPICVELEKQNTFRRACDIVYDLEGDILKKVDDAISTFEYRANNWQDMVGGLNQMLSDGNKIDPSVLGRGK